MHLRTSFFATALCLTILPSAAAFATDVPLLGVDCSSDADCTPDEFCMWIDTADCAWDEESETCLPSDDMQRSGVCQPLASEETCASDDDCADGFQCEFPTAACAIVCVEEGDADCEVQCAPPSSEGRCAEVGFQEGTECYDNADCAAGEECHYVMYAIEDGSGSSPPASPGMCGPAAGGRICSSDSDCDGGEVCEISWVSGCAMAGGDAEDENVEVDCEPVEPQGICVGREPPPFWGHCQQDEDCGPGGVCLEDFGWCEYEVERPIEEGCWSDEDCGVGGFCVYNNYECPPGVACMMPAVEAYGACVYDDGPIDEEVCIIQVYDQCVVYGGGRSELSCESTSAAPSWLAFLAVLGWVRRRRN